VKKIFYIARREFLATVATKGFLISVLVMPVLLGMVILVMPRLMKEESPRIDGDVVVVDPTGQVTAGVRVYLAPEAIAARREEATRAVTKAAADKLGPLATATAAGAASQQALQSALGQVPSLTLLEVVPSADLEHEKEPLKADLATGQPRLAVVVVHPDAVVRAAGKEAYGSYDLYVRAKLDDRLEDEIKDALRHSIVDARARDQGLDLAAVEQLTSVKRARSITVTAEGERRTNEVLNVLLPGGFMLLLLVSVMSSGQHLMTTTIEEKSSRVVEVLLSAVSPMQLMTGKILGQMAVGLVILALYAGLGIAALVNFAMLGLLDPMLFLYLLIFFLIAYFVVASLMAAIGSAVNELREA
jgi:ABC-type Na+ efflux pump permease subunit